MHLPANSVAPMITRNKNPALIWVSLRASQSLCDQKILIAKPAKNAEKQPLNGADTHLMIRNRRVMVPFLLPI